jgi:hypothetical protein
MSKYPDINSPRMEDEKYKKLMRGIFLDFFRDASMTFKGRVDEGKITIAELHDFIDKWVEKHFK